MQITLFINQDDNNKVNKNLVAPIVYEGTLREETSLMNPSIVISGEDTKLFRYNYAYIPDFQRYYFINKITSVRNGLVRIEMNVDVLMSFKEEFLKNRALIASSQKAYNLYLEDNHITTQIDREISDQKVIPTIFGRGITGVLNVLNTTRNALE